MPKSNQLTPAEVSKLIEQDIKSRLLAMVSKSLDYQVVEQRFAEPPEVARQVRILSSLNWSRLLIGRMFLELLRMRQVIWDLAPAPKGSKRPEPRPDDVMIEELGGRPISNSDFLPVEWNCLSSFITNADKIVHLTMAPNRIAEVTDQVDDAIPLIAKAMDICFYSYRNPPVPNPTPPEYRKKHKF